MKKEVIRFLKAFFCREFFYVLTVMILLAFSGTIRGRGDQYENRQRITIGDK